MIQRALYQLKPLLAGGWMRVDADPTQNEVPTRWPDWKTGELTIQGTGNQVVIGQDARLIDQKIRIFGSGNRVEIGEGCRLVGTIFIRGDGATVRIGAGTTTRGLEIVAGEGAGVEIGRDCMFSYRITIRTTDSHALIDRATGLRMNRAAPVVIGHHVWVNPDCLLLRGAEVPGDCVLGTGAMVSKVLPQASALYVGRPARLARENITWSRSPRQKFNVKRLDRLLQEMTED